MWSFKLHDAVRLSAAVAAITTKRKTNGGPKIKHCGRHPTRIVGRQEPPHVKPVPADAGDEPLHVGKNAVGGQGPERGV